jgi:hypothetical protein
MTLYSNYDRHNRKSCSVPSLHIPVSANTGFRDNYKTVDYPTTMFSTMCVLCNLIPWLSVITLLFGTLQWTMSLLYTYTSVTSSPTFRGAHYTSLFDVYNEHSSVSNGLCFSLYRPQRHLRMWCFWRFKTSRLYKL